jgi:hypothetical protein
MTTVIWEMKYVFGDVHPTSNASASWA